MKRIMVTPIHKIRDYVAPYFFTDVEGKLLEDMDFEKLREKFKEKTRLADFDVWKFKIRGYIKAIL